MITLEKIRVELVEMQHLDLILEAWRHSRPNDTKSTLEEVLALDLPVNEMAQISVRFFVPILLREYIVTARNHHIWARTSRVDDLSNWPIYEGTDNPHLVGVRLLKEGYDAAAKEMHQDQARMKLPLAYMTHFTASFTLRDYVSLYHNLASDAREAHQLGQRAIARLFFETVGAMQRVIPEHLRDAVFKDRSVKRIVPMAEQFLETVREFKNFIFIQCNIPIALRAQVVRHRAILVSDDLRSFFLDFSLCWPISSEMNCGFTMTRETALIILSTRNCWIAQEGLWAPFLKQVREALGVKDKHELPCDPDPVTGCECPYQRDNELRIEGKDPGPPCPRFANLYRRPLSIEHKLAAVDYAQTRSDTEFWIEELNK